MTVVYRSPFIPREWIAAHGLDPVRLVPDGRNVPTGPIPEVEGVCSFLRAFVNEACHLEGATALVLTTFCDQVRRACEIAQSDSDLPVHLFNLVSTWQTPAAQKLYAAELERLSRFMVRMGGRRPSDDELRDVMLTGDSLRQSTGLQPEAFARLQPHAAGLRPGEGFRLKGGTLTGQRVPIALLGGPLQHKDAAIFDWIAEAGAFVALDATETGERTQRAAFNRRRVNEDPFDELCQAYFGTIPDAFRRPNTELYRWTRKKIHEHEIRGVILVRYVWCDTWHAEVRRFQEWLPVPCIDLDFTADPPGARTRTRIEAFLESMQ